MGALSSWDKKDQLCLFLLLLSLDGKHLLFDPHILDDDHKVSVTDGMFQITCRKNALGLDGTTWKSDFDAHAFFCSAGLGWLKYLG